MVEYDITLPRGISWTLFQYATDCHKKVEFYRRKTPRKNRDWPTYYADIGTSVQRIFELYFGQGVNLRGEGQSPATVSACAEKILLGDVKLLKLFDQTTYPDGKNRSDMLDQIRSDVRTGLHAIHSAGFLGKKVRCEVKAPGRISGWPTFGSIDFLVENEDGTDEVWDGKAVSQRRSNTDQVLWYTLSRIAEGKVVSRGGIIYFRQGVAQAVDVSPENLRRFVKQRFQPTEEVWRALKRGVSSLDANPRDGRSTCYRCDWRDHCPESYMKKQPADLDGPREIDFDYFDAIERYHDPAVDMVKEA